MYKKLLLVWMMWMLGVIGGSVAGNAWLKARGVGATDRTITTRVDFEVGLMTDTETKSKEGELRLRAAGTWGARVWKTPKIALTNQAGVVSDGTYVYLLGQQDRYFARYIPNEDRWQTLTNAPHAAYNGTDLVIFGNYIYAVFGSWTKNFSRYSITNNTWENLDDVPDLIGDGASVETDGTYIYLLRGSSTTDFWRYDPSNSSEGWSILTGPPATIGAGANLVYYNGYLFTPRGAGTATLYRYGIGGTWAAMTANIPAGISANQNADDLGGYLYLPQGNGGSGFYRYNLSQPNGVGTTWNTLTTMPQTTAYVGAVGVGDTNTGFVYVFRGNGTYDFWKYNPRTSQFEGLVDLPNTFSTGSDLVYWGSNVFYAPRGNNSANFYRYTIGGTWAAMANTLANFNDDTKGIKHGNYLYFVIGSGSTGFYRYDPTVGTGGTWAPMLGTPVSMYYGASIVGVGDSYLYATRGALTRTFYRYTIGAGETWSDAAATDLPDNAEANYGSRLATDGTDIYYLTGAGMGRLYKYMVGTTTWSELGSLPFAPYYGTDMVYYNGKLYCTAGNLKPDFWEYSIAEGSWRRLPPMQTYGLTEIGPWAGASLESGGSGVLYATYGNSVYRMLSYTVDGSKYAVDGSWRSNTMDLTYVAGWSGMTIGASTPVGTGISWYTRTSSDQSSWSSWLLGTGTSIGSPPNRYLEIGTSLIASAGGSETPTLYSASVSYVGDTGPPTNPTTVLGYSQQVSGVGLTSGGSYSYVGPYFSWSGATDPETSVAGYYVYFGGGSGVDPGVSGSYQTASSYTVYGPMDQGTYYLRLKTVDGVGNTSAATTVFTYIYAGIAPPVSLVQSSSVEFALGTTASVNVSGDEIKLQGRLGYWDGERLSSWPAGIYYGSAGMAYSSSTNKLYMFRGYGANTFYIYDLGTNTMSTGPTAPATIYYGSDITEGPSGYLYAMRGYGQNGFYRFTVGTTTWSDSAAADVPALVSYGGAVVYDGSRYMYVLKGNGDDAFYRYDTTEDGWDQMANADFNQPTNQPNNNVGDGGDLAYDGNGAIYAIQGGGRDGFATYSVAGNSWTVLGDLPMIAGAGAQMTYDSATNAIYYVPGLGRTFFYKYDIASQTWSDLTEVPNVVSAGAALKNVNGDLYLAIGGGSAAMYKYDIGKNSWLIPTVGLFDGWFRGSDSRTFLYGADIVKGDEDNYYLTRGYYDNLFVRYNATTGVSTKMADAPFGFWVGSELVYDSTRNRIYTAGNIYFRKMYYYDIATDSWVEETQDPPPFDSAEGSSMAYSSSTGLIYWLRGGNSNTFRTFNPVGVGTSKWLAPVGATTPGTVQYGSDMVINGDYIYALRGYNSVGTYRYGPLSVGGTWVDAGMTDLPTGANVYNDGFIVDAGSDDLFACRGGNSQACYLYDIGTTTWSLVGSTLAPYIYQGGAAAYNGSDKIYVISGNGQLNTFSNGLYTFVISGTDSAFEESGTYISPVHDLTSVYRFAHLSVGFTAPSGAGLTVYTRTSADNVTWSDWVEASDRKAIGISWNYKVNSSANRYLQVKLALTGNGVHSGKVNDYTVSYYQDVAEPSNPIGLAAYTDSGMGTTMVSGVWNNSTAPYFSWSGATDGSNGSGVAGYYVYLGTGATADPGSVGTYTTVTATIGVGLTSGQTYYFRLKTKDNANNMTSGVGTTFVYKFDSGGPSNPTTLTVDPPGYTATNSFNFNWSEAEDVGSSIASYCYKTGAVGATDTCISGVGVSGIEAYRTGTNTFYLRSRDSAGNYASDYATATYYYSSVAPGAPTNLRLTTPSVGTSNTVNEFAFAWDAPATYYGQQSGLRYYYSINEMPSASNVNDVGLSVTYLSAGAYATRKGANTFYVVAKDEAGNIDYSTYASTDFTAETSAPGMARNIDISDVSIKETSSWRLALSWDAPEATGSGVSTYKVYRSITSGASCSSDFSNFSYVSSATTTSYVDVSLSQVRYYYCAKACDSTSECSAVSDTVTYLPDGRWKVAPSLTSGPTAAVKTKSAIVTWTTSRTSSSFVKYGKSAGNYGAEVGSSNQVSSHSISLTGLDPGTTYYYKVLWTDEDGNTGSSDEKTLVTNPAPIVSTVKVTDVGLYSVYVQFGLNHASKATVQYGKTTNYGSLQAITTATSESTYTVKLDSLSDGTKYHLRIVAEDEEANVFSSDDYEFETLPVPKLSDIKVQQVRGAATATIRVVWKSNTGVSSIISYYPKGRVEASKDAIQLTLSLNHQMIVKDLLDDTDYVLMIKGKDVGGNEAAPSIIDFKTSADMRAPEISELRAEAAVSGVGDQARGKIVINWNTDEAASSQVEYGEGTGSDYPSKTQDDPNLTMNHVVTIPDLKPGMVYHLRVVTKDKIGNIAQSYDNVVVMPKETKSALDLVVGSLSKSFGFFNNLSQVAK